MQSSTRLLPPPNVTSGDYTPPSEPILLDMDFAQAYANCWAQIKKHCDKAAEPITEEMLKQIKTKGSRETHPDKNPNDPKAKERYQNFHACLTFMTTTTHFARYQGWLQSESKLEDLIKKYNVPLPEVVPSKKREKPETNDKTNSESNKKPRSFDDPSDKLGLATCLSDLYNSSSYNKKTAEERYQYLMEYIIPSFEKGDIKNGSFQKMFFGVIFGSDRIKPLFDYISKNKQYYQEIIEFLNNYPDMLSEFSNKFRNQAAKVQNDLEQEAATTNQAILKNQAIIGTIDNIMQASIDIFVELTDAIANNQMEKFSELKKSLFKILAEIPANLTVNPKAFDFTTNSTSIYAANYYDFLSDLPFFKYNFETKSWRQVKHQSPGQNPELKSFDNAKHTIIDSLKNLKIAAQDGDHKSYSSQYKRLNLAFKKIPNNVVYTNPIDFNLKS